MPFVVALLASHRRSAQARARRSSRIFFRGIENVNLIVHLINGRVNFEDCQKWIVKLPERISVSVEVA